MAKVSLTLVVSKDAPIDLDKEITAFEREVIRRALMETHGVHAAAARLLLLGRTTLIEKMRRHGLALHPPSRR